MSNGTELASIVLEMSNQESIKKGDGVYYPRSSAVSRCVRDMAMHRYGEPWSDDPEASWGTQIRFDLGHDTEDRLIKMMEDAGISIVCQQMRVSAMTPGGLEVIGHMDGIACIPHEYGGLGGKWYVLDIKSAGKWMYGKIYDPNISKPKREHIKQIAVYSQSVVKDFNFPGIEVVKVQDLCFDGYEFGGGLVGYLSIERPTKGYGDKKVDLPKIHFCEFDIDPVEVEVWLEDAYDLVEDHFNRGTIPAIPDSDDEMVWGGIRCSPRWCRRYSVCKGLVPPSSKELEEVLNG
jgi:hypothetical protein